MANQAKFYHVEFQPIGSDKVQELILREADRYDTFKEFRSFIRNELFPNFDIRTAEGNFMETVQDQLHHIDSEHRAFTVNDYMESINSAMTTWKDSIPDKYTQLSLSEFHVASWHDFDCKSHLVFGAEPLDLLQNVCSEIKDVNKLIIHEVSRQQADSIEERIQGNDFDKALENAAIVNDLLKRIQVIADAQLDFNARWMFENEWDFRANFTEFVLERLKYNTKCDLNSVSDNAIMDAVFIEGNNFDYDLSLPLNATDRNDLAETFKMFQNNKFKNAEKYPWLIQPSSNPDFPYDWVLWNNKLPVVMYDSKNKQICPCLEIGEANLNEISTVIRSAAHKKNGQYILSVADKEKVKNSGRV